MNKPEAIIVDLDGTLSDCTHRRHLAQEKNWKAFYEALVDDPVNEPVRNTVEALAESYAVLLVSGRPLDYLHHTLVWLDEKAISHDELHMRKSGDNRDDTIVKREILAELRKKYDIVMAFDDRDRVVKMWRDEGIPCFQVAEGNF
ncbi:MAG: polynucleotide kinase [Anaerolineae bacterium]|nr:polynucleotide kinase [Anaerolineae bacterium]